jgi:hypothetical protein
MPYPYKVNQPVHSNGRRYSVVVEGDTNYVPDSSSAIEVGRHSFILPYKPAPHGNTEWVHAFSLPYVCDNIDPQFDVDLEAKSGSTSLSGGRRVVRVHDVT